MKTKLFLLLFAIVASTSTLFSQSSGTCGENLTWVLSQNTLTISGTGDMDDYCSMASYSSCYAPWHSSRSKIKNVIIENGVTSIGSAAFQDCSVLESVEISNNVINIGASAFNGCSSLTYLTIPNSVINIRGAAFKNCTSLLSVTIGNSVTNIEYAAFSGCTHLTSVHIFDVSAWCGILFEADEETNPLVYAHNLYLNGNLIENLNISSNITSIESYTFSGCTCMTSIRISNSVTSIGESAFSDCSALTSIYCESAAPASISDNTFKNVSPSVYVPQCAYTTYQNAPIWKDMTIVPVQINMQVANNEGGVVVETCGSMEIEAIPFDGYHFKKWLDGNTGNPRAYSLQQTNLNFIAQFEINKYTITLNCDANQGSIIGDKGKYNYNTDHTIEAVPNYGYHFTQWSDGETENPRTFIVTQDTTFTAEFAIDKNGTCGDELALTWNYDDEAKELTIGGAGSLNSNYTFGVESPTSVEKVIFDEGVTSVGNSAFANYTTLEEIHLATTIKRIYEQAFYNCENLVNIYCYRDVPCVVYNNTFDGIDKFSCTLHVPGASIEMYKAATGWRDFYYVVALPEPTPTGIDQLENGKYENVKIVKDGQILILRGEKVYTVTGQEVR